MIISISVNFYLLQKNENSSKLKIFIMLNCLDSINLTESLNYFWSVDELLQPHYLPPSPPQKNRPILFEAIERLADGDHERVGIVVASAASSVWALQRFTVEATNGDRARVRDNKKIPKKQIFQIQLCFAIAFTHRQLKIKMVRLLSDVLILKKKFFFLQKCLSSVLMDSD